MASILELKADLEEVEKLLGVCTRTRLRNLLEKEQSTLKKILEQTSTAPTSSSDQPPAATKASGQSPSASSGKNYKVIKSFGWDGSAAKTVKIYVSLKGVGQHDTSKIHSNFEERSVEIKVDDFKDSNYIFSATGLLEQIVPDQSNIKVKGDDIIVTLKKQKEGIWRHLKRSEKEAADKKKKQETEEKKVEDDDPSKSIMNMMKKMYDEGDDEMKRTIAKAWTESREKQAGGGAGGDMMMPDI